MKRNILIVFSANVFNMLFSLITNFFLPKYLSIESYGYYKTFQLYVNYVGITHLGYADGVYLKYGGKQISDIDTREILATTSSIRSMQLIFTVILTIVASFCDNNVAILLAISCFPINMVSYFKNLFQATGKFKNYGLIVCLLPLLAFLANLFLVYIIRTDSCLFYIGVTVITNFIVYIFLEVNFWRLFRGNYFSLKLYWEIILANIIMGFPLMIGNLISLLITSIDRWFIQVVMEISFFSYYSFAVSVENLFNVCTSAVTTTLYNYLCKNKSKERIIRIKSFCIIIAAYLVSVAFPVKAIINIWLDKYIPSIPCLFLLICAHMFYFVIKAIYVNLYKANAKQKYYFQQMIIVLIIAMISNIFFYYLYKKSIYSVALATFITAFIWYHMCFFKFKELRGDAREIIQLFLCVFIYLFCGLKIESAVIGCSLYLVMITLFIYLLNKDIFVDFLRGIRNFVLLNIGGNVSDKN